MRKSKTSFFAALERLDDPDDSQDDEVTSLDDLLTSSRPKKIPEHAISSTSTSAESLSLRRVNSEPQISSINSELQITGATSPHAPLQRSTTTDDLEVRTVQRAQMTTGMPGAKTGGGPGGPVKKKRKVDALKVVPSDQQVLKGLVFCKTSSVLTLAEYLTIGTVFFPNSDVSPSRRLRIQRAREYGAQRATEWTDTITHVIVDKGLVFQDLVTHLRITSFSVSKSLGIILSFAHYATGNSRQ